MLQRVQPISADAHRIKWFSVDVNNKIIEIKLESGHIVGNTFVTNTSIVEQSTIYIKNSPQQTVSTLETITFATSGQIELQYTPEIGSTNIPSYVEGVNYTVNGNVVTNIDIPTIGDFSISYDYIVLATYHFDELASSIPNGIDNIYDTISELLWTKLINLGYASGTFIK